MRVAVTGAAGYLGLNLVNELIGDGHDVIAIDARIPPSASQGPVRWLPADVLDADSLDAAFAGAELVFHLAAKITLRDDDPTVWELNTRGVGNAAGAALRAGVRRMVHCSSVHAFDTTLPALDESSRRVQPDAPLYDRSKLAGEEELRPWIARGLDAVIANPTGVFGPVDHPGHLSRMNGILRDATLGKVPLTVQGGFDWVDVRDVAHGLVLAAEHGRSGENYLLGAGTLSMRNAMGRAASAVGRIGPVLTIPLGVLKAILPIAEPISRWMDSDVLSEAAVRSLELSPRVDSAKARAELGFAPRPHGQTIRELVAFFVQTGVLERTRRNDGRANG